MSPKIFMTGASGYIGGQFLHNISSKHPDYQITALVRTEAQKTAISKLQPATTFVIGDLDSNDIIVEESSKADVVLQLADADHVPATHSIMEGIVLGGKKGVFIHLSGAANIFSTLLHHGTASTKTWSDIHDLPQIQNFDETHIHHTTEQLLFHAQETHGIKSAIVAPAGIFGVGEGIKKLSFGIPPLLEAFKKRGKMFAVNEGLNTMAASHVKDVADVLVMFVEEALEAESKKITWGGDAFYYVESGGYVFADLAAAVGKLMVEKGLIGSEEVERISPEEVLEMHFAAALMWGSNMDVKADRLKGLGWEPKQKDVFEYLEEMLPRGA